MIVKSDSIKSIVTALAEARKNFKPVVKNLENTYLTEKSKGKDVKYANLEQILEAVTPALEEQGLGILQFPISDANGVGVFTLLAHESGEFVGAGFTLPLKDPNAQMGVAAVTYARRTAIKGVTGIAEKDDDGNSATFGDDVRGNYPSNPLDFSDRDMRDTGEPITRPGVEPQYDPKPAGVPKAEIPEVVLPTGGTAPTKEQEDAFQKRIHAMASRLNTEAGLVPSRGKGITTKVNNYLIRLTNNQKPSVEQYEAFFHYASKTDFSLLVRRINGEQ